MFSRRNNLLVRGGVTNLTRRCEYFECLEVNIIAEGMSSRLEIAYKTGVENR